MKKEILKELNRIKSELENNNTDKAKALLEVVENAIKGCNISEDSIYLSVLYRMFITQFHIIQSQPMPPFENGGISVKNTNVKYGVISDKEIVINKTI